MLIARFIHRILLEILFENVVHIQARLHYSTLANFQRKNALYKYFKQAICFIT